MWHKRSQVRERDRAKHAIYSLQDRLVAYLPPAAELFQQIIAFAARGRGGSSSGFASKGNWSAVFLPVRSPMTVYMNPCIPIASDT